MYVGEPFKNFWWTYFQMVTLNGQINMRWTASIISWNWTLSKANVFLPLQQQNKSSDSQRNSYTLILKVFSFGKTTSKKMKSKNVKR